jgi:K+-sensing histidine kinase KdpD
VLRYGIAGATVVGAAALTVLLTEVIEPMTSSLFLAAVMISAWLGGFGPGLAATALGVLGLDYVVLGSAPWLGINRTVIARLTLFTLVALLISWLNETRKRAERERARLLTSERAARRQAEAANRAKDVFVAMVSHERWRPSSRTCDCRRG